MPTTSKAFGGAEGGRTEAGRAQPSVRADPRRGKGVLNKRLDRATHRLVNPPDGITKVWWDNHLWNNHPVFLDIPPGGLTHLARVNQPCGLTKAQALG